MSEGVRMEKGPDPRERSDRYFKKQVKKFDVDKFDFKQTLFLIDDNYVGNPPKTQVSVFNLNDNIDENFLRREFGITGSNCKQLLIVRHPETRKHLRMAQIDFSDSLTADAIINKFHGKKVMGSELILFKDLRFKHLRKKADEAINPPPPPPPPTQPATVQHANPLGLGLVPVGLQASLLPIAPLSTTSTGPFSALSTISSLPTTPSLGTPNLPPTPGSHTLSSSATPAHTLSSSIANSANRLSLSDRLASLNKGTIIPPANSLPQVPLVPMVNNNSYNQQLNLHHKYGPSHSLHHNLNHVNEQPPRHHMHQHQHPHHPHHHHHHHHYDKHANQYTSDRSPDNESPYDDDWNIIKKPKVELPTQLTGDQIENDILPGGYRHFERNLIENLVKTVEKKLIEQFGYPLADEKQRCYMEKQDRVKLERERLAIERQRQKEFEMKFMSTKARTERTVQVPRPRINVTRQKVSGHDTHRSGMRGSAYNNDGDDLRRKNRSSAFVTDTDRRGRHTSITSSNRSDGNESSSRTSSPGLGSLSSSSSSSSSSTSSSASSSASSSRSSSRSSSPDSSSRSSISRGSYSQEMSVMPKPKTLKTEQIDVQDNRLGDEEDAVYALLGLAAPNATDFGDNRIANDFNDHQDSELKNQKANINKKKKKSQQQQMEIHGVASEYRATKKFASGNENELNSSEQNENEILSEKPEIKYIFPKRSLEEEERLISDLQLIDFEDIDFLERVHSDSEAKRTTEIPIPFGSLQINKNNIIKPMIDSRTPGHPKWWRGCSRCDVIVISEKVQEEENYSYEDLTKAPIKSHVIQAAGTSSRRDQRGDQRRIAVLNEHLDADIIKMYTTSTLQMRAKNLRFSRSKIHKWGLFACEKIANGDAVIEYVGEKIRPSLADHREKFVYTNLPTHDGSSYFFRVDFDVIDATLKGNKARFINHSCNPNCIAKVIKHDNGTNSIVIYAKQVIKEDEEITYDYKFPREEQKIRCNCRAPECKKFLN